MHNGNQTSAPANDRQLYFQTIATSKDASDYLHDVIDLLADHAQETNPVIAINELSASLLSQSPTDWDDPQTKRNLHTVLQLGAFMTRLRETYAAFESEAEELTDETKKEGENE